MEKTSSFTELFKKYWITILIAVQPLLDILAYWTRSPDGTAAGMLRLAIMLIMPLHLLITLKDKKRFILSMALIGLAGALHAANCLRVGYIDMRFDLVYLARTMQMPVLAICLSYYIGDETKKEAAMRGLLYAGLIYFTGLILAVVTGTATDTYGPGLGVSGWVIGENRCANSVICVTLALVLLYFSVKSDEVWLNVVVPPLMAFALIMNGTKACYYSLFAAYVGFAVFLVIDKLLHGGRLRTRIIAVLLLTAIVSAAVYPITPRHLIEITQQRSSARQQDELERIIQELGYDLKSMTLEEKLADPVIVQIFGDYYYDLIWAIIPDMFARFTYPQICAKYKFNTNAGQLINVRLMKYNYASLIWDEKDALTHLVGYEPSEMWYGANTDLENDWPAIYFYYGYLGFGLYAAFLLYFVWLILKRLLEDFKGTITLENFFLLLLFFLHVGLAQFSGSVIRRPNVSIYMSLVLALIACKTTRYPITKERPE